MDEYVTRIEALVYVGVSLLDVSKCCARYFAKHLLSLFILSGSEQFHCRRIGMQMANCSAQPDDAISLLGELESEIAAEQKGACAYRKEEGNKLAA